MKFFKKKYDTEINLVFHTQQINGLPLNIKNKIIVIASDYHFVPENLMIPEQSVQKINEQNPDIVLLLGDFITNSPDRIEKLAQILKNIKAKDGVFAIYGKLKNYYYFFKTLSHDIKWGKSVKEQVQKALTEIAGIKILENEQVWPWGKEFTIVGLGDWWSKDKQDFRPEIAFQNIPNNTPRIVLAHNPDSVLALKDYRTDLVLSGHTHGIDRSRVLNKVALVTKVLPNSWNKKIPLAFLSEYKQSENDPLGVYILCNSTKQNEHERQLIVTSGIGSHSGEKKMYPPEVMVIKLQRKQ